MLDVFPDGAPNLGEETTWTLKIGQVRRFPERRRRISAQHRSRSQITGGRGWCGVVGDVAGFAAASYLRGVDLVHIPTTLVLQVDSSIGGKTGVNLPEGKNLVRLVLSARLVLTDPELLRSLSGREFRGGLAEVIKHAIIADAEMFAMLEKDMEKCCGGIAKP